MVIDFPRDIKDVLVGQSEDRQRAVVRSSRRAYVIGVEIGQTNVFFFFDAEGKQMVGLDIAVTRILNGIRVGDQAGLPESDIRVERDRSRRDFDGFVSSPAEAQQAFAIATRLCGMPRRPKPPCGTKVVNAIVVRGRDQIMLKVTVAEVERDLIKQLGINLSGSVGFGIRRHQF